jgi:hypothetical protein
MHTAAAIFSLAPGVLSPSALVTLKSRHGLGSNGGGPAFIARQPSLLRIQLRFGGKSIGGYGSRARDSHPVSELGAWAYPSATAANAAHLRSATGTNAYWDARLTEPAEDPALGSHSSGAKSPRAEDLPARERVMRGNEEGPDGRDPVTV